MVVGYKDRTYTHPINCEVYRNLQTGSISVRAKEGQHYGRVIDHCDQVYLTNCQFTVNESGRQKVISNNRKNVHATVVGTLQSEAESIKNPIPLTYNPYKFSSFVTKDGHIPVDKAQSVLINVSDTSVEFIGSNVTTST